MKHFTASTLLMVVAAACTGQTPDPESASDFEDVEESSDFESGDEIGASQNATPEGAPARCVDENDEPIECEDDAECCEGFECGYDPEGSTRIKLCVWTGD